MKQRLAYLGLSCAALMAGLIAVRLLWMPKTIATMQSARAGENTLVLDAGHGGEDGGAVSGNGIPESGINLDIVLRLDQIMGLYGVAPVLTRDGDYAIYTDGAKTLREKKVSDIRNRVALIERQPGATLISIHQNSYPNPKYSGAQVFFSAAAESRTLGEHIQQGVAAALDPGNQRVATRIPDTVYLMNHITCRAVLVECGFLTNPQEEQLLRDPNYQTKLAAAVAGAYLTEDTDQTGEESLYEG